MTNHDKPLGPANGGPTCLPPIVLCCSICGALTQFDDLPSLEALVTPNGRPAASAALPCGVCQRTWMPDELEASHGTVTLDGGTSARLVVGVSIESQGQVCRACSCTVTTPCPGGCYWIEPDLCNSCAAVAGVTHS